MRVLAAIGAIVPALAGSVAYADGDADGACSADWATTTYARVSPAVVRIVVGNGEAGAGFVFGDACHVATALHVVQSGRTLRVTLPDGNARSATVVAADSEHDLAILQLSDCAQNVAPLKAASVPKIGAPVMAVGHPLLGASEPTGSTGPGGPYHGLLGWSATTGIVSAYSDRFVQTDAVVLPGSSGGPLVDCHGDVVGVVDQLGGVGIGFAVATAWLDPLLRRAIAAPRGYSPGVRFTASIGLQFDLRSSDGYQGVFFADALVIKDAWWMSVRLSYLPWGGPYAPSGPTTNPSYPSNAARLTIDAAVGPRWLLFPFSPFVTYLQIAAGGGLAGEQWTLTQLSVAPGGGAILSTPTNLRATRWEPLGMVGLFIGSKGTVELSYSYRVDVERVLSSTSEVVVGLWF